MEVKQTVDFFHYTSASSDPTPATVWSTEWAWRTSGSVDTRTSRWRRRERWRTSTSGWPSSWPGVSTFVWRAFGEQTSLGWHNASTVAGGIVCVGCSLWIPPSIIWADVPIVWRGTHENSKGMRGRVGSAQARCCGFQKSEDEKLLPCSWQRWFSLGTSESIWTVDNQKAADLFLTLKQWSLISLTWHWLEGQECDCDSVSSRYTVHKDWILRRGEWGCYLTMERHTARR